jgi:EKC/KEOPS complex subunit CGI121/TPRKB
MHASGREIRELVMSGNLEPEVAAINAAVVPELFGLHAAAYRVLLGQARNSLRTKTLHSELLLMLAASRHVRGPA